MLDPPADAPQNRRFDDRLARMLRAFGPLGLVVIVVILAGDFFYAPLSAVLVLLWAWRSGTFWREIGFVRPQSWASTILAGLAFGVALKMVMKAIVMPLLGAPAINQAFHFLAGNTAALPGIFYTVIVIAGFGEEIVFRGYLFERFRKLIGQSIGAKIVTVSLTAAWFGWLHYDFQGLAGAQQATLVGLIFGGIFAATGRIWMLIAAHAAFDLTAVAIIYWQLEEAVAHFFFR